MKLLSRDAVVQIVRYEPAFKPQVLELQRGLWSHDPATNAAYFAWKYERNPYLQEPLLHLALADGRVIGVRGVWGAQWEAGDPVETFRAPCAGDLIVDPAYRSQGLAARIVEAAAADLAASSYPWIVNLSARLETQLSSLMAGWRAVGPLELARWGSEPPRLWRGLRAYAYRLAPLRRAASTSALLRRVVDRTSRVPTTRPHPFELLDRQAAGRSGGGAPPIAVERTPRPEAMAELIERIGRDERLRHVRDPVYLAWRYQNPLQRYRFLFWTDARLEGYLVLQAPRYRPRAGLGIVDWEASDPSVRADLLRAAMQWGRPDELSTWSATLAVDTKALLREAGFVVESAPGSLGRAHRAHERRPKLLVKSLGSATGGASDWTVAGRRLLDLSSWDLRMVYSDDY